MTDVLLVVYCAGLVTGVVTGNLSAFETMLCAGIAIVITQINEFLDMLNGEGVDE